MRRRDQPRVRRLDVAIAVLLIACGVFFGRIADAADGSVTAKGGSGSSSGSSGSGSSNDGSSGGSGGSRSTGGGGDTGGGADPGDGGGGNGGTTPGGGGGPVEPGPTVTSVVSGDNRAGGSTSDVDVTVVDIDVNTGDRVTRVERRVNQAPLATVAALLIVIVVAGVVAVAVRESGRPR